MTCAACHTENAEESRECISCSAPLIGPVVADSDRTQIQTQTSISSSWTETARRDNDFEPGSDFGPRYRIERLLGQGGMGKVYKAYDRDLDRTVAIKVVREGAIGESDALKRFKQELVLASKISHKNILRIHDMGDVGGLRFISMAFV